MMSDIKDRLAWLRRMPTRWRILLGSQAVVFMIAIRIRISDVNRSRELALLREAAEQQKHSLQQVDSSDKKKA
jgi:cell division protein FtsW (lipid II flippase)